MMRHAENMLQKDNMQLAQENKQFAESKPKGLYNKIRHSDERPEKYEEEAVDHQIDSQYKSKEAQRESLKSELERRRGDVASAIADEYKVRSVPGLQRG